MIQTKPSRKNLSSSDLRKNFRDQQSQRSNLPKLSFWTQNQPGSVKISSKREFWKIASLTLLASQNTFSSQWNSNFFWKALLGSYLSNKVVSTPTRRVLCILESKTWSSGVFWVLRPKINPVQSKSVQKESFGRLLLWLCWSLKFFLKSLELKIFSRRLCWDHIFWTQ